MENAMVYGAFAGAFFFFFPIFLSLDAYTDFSENKAFFSLSVFKIIKIFGGYIVMEKDGLAIHISKRKAIFIDYTDLKSQQKKFEITAGFQLYTLRTSLELGDEYFPFAGFYTAVFTQLISQTIYPWLSFHKDFINLKNGTLLLHGDTALKATLHLVTVFNQLSVIMALSKIALEGIINLWQKKKNTKPSKV